MKYSVSTIAFPGYEIKKLLHISSCIGLDGVDVRVPKVEEKNGEHVPMDTSKAEREKIADYASSLGILFSGIYGYAGRKLADQNPKVREKEVQLIKAQVDLAVDLRASHVRIFQGNSERTEKKIQTFIQSCQEAAAYAQSRGIAIGLETHGELAYNAKLCNRLIEGIGLDNVRIIFDPANLQNLEMDPVGEGRKMWENIAYVQFKDWRSKNQPSGEIEPVPLGEGEVNINGLIDLLKQKHYNGWICLEYEKKYCPALPDPEEGLKHELEYIKHRLES